MNFLFANGPSPQADGALWLLLAFPLLGALVCAGLALCRRARPRLVAAVAVGAMVGASGAGLAALGRLLARSPEQRFLLDHLFTFLAVDRLKVDVALAFDPLAAVFVLVITLVGTLIHIYAAAYMRGDAGYARFFACLNLFVFAMLLLVLGDSLLLCFVGWEGVGLCSYLLIGHWFAEPNNGAAAKKAFITNRIGDAGFLAAMLLLVATFGGAFAAPGDLLQSGATVQVGEGAPVALGPTLQFRSLEALLAARDAGGQAVVTEALLDARLWGLPVLGLICVGLFLGMSGKSAQIPLYLWLPDAMAGPTPVSALIHAATMVTAGVYLAARLAFLFALSPGAGTMLAVVGVATALVGAVLALVQQDIKKVLAYSTISQLGFMFLGLGAGAPGTAVFHVVTHACFKACLFLAAGSLIHAMAHVVGHQGPLSEKRRRLTPEPSDPQDLRNMHALGGLAQALPRTHLGYLAGALALAGLPVASGFFSKDELLYRALHAPGLLVPGALLYGLGLFTAGLTALYVARSYYLAFSGPAAPGRPRPHEAPPLMTVPVLVLAGAAIVIGPLLGWPAAWGGRPLLEHFLRADGPASHAGALLGQLAGALVALGGWLVGRALYREGRGLAALAALRGRFDGVHRVLWNRLHADDLGRALVVHPAQDFSRWATWLDAHLVDGTVALLARVTRALAALGRLLDRYLLDGIVDGVAHVLLVGGRRVQRLQTGRLNHYTLGITLGAALMVALAWIIR